MNRNEIKEKLAVKYEELQDLDIKPTMHNMETLLSTLYAMRDVFNYLEEEEKNEQSWSEADHGDGDNRERGSWACGQSAETVDTGNVDDAGGRDRI